MRVGALVATGLLMLGCDPDELNPVHQGVGLDPGFHAGQCSLAGATRITQGLGRISQMFVGDAGIYLVSDDISEGEVVLVDRRGRVLARRPRSDEVLGVARDFAFDGLSLVAIYARAIRRYDSRLLPVGDAPIDAQQCLNGTLFEEHLLCDVNWSGIVSYELETGNRSAVTPRAPDAMDRIPGTDELLISYTSAPLELHRISASGALELEGAALLGSTRLLHPWGFIGSPPTHVVLSDGSLFCIHSEQCELGAGVPAVLAEDGHVGSLVGDQHFRAFAGDSQGRLRALVERAPPSCGGGWCCAAAPCVVQDVDRATGVVTAEAMMDVGVAGWLEFFLSDPQGGVITLCSSLNARGMYGFRVARFD